MRAPQFFIAGEMKCGSTTLWDLFVSDPRVFQPNAKELHVLASYRYFGGSGDAEMIDYSPYLKLFEGADDSQLIGEATPNYMYDTLAPARLAEVAPDAKHFVILRNPVERAWSHYWHQVRRGWEKLSFEKAIEAEEKRITSGDLQDRDAFSYIDRGFYARNLERFSAAVGRESVLVLTLDELRADPASVLSRVSRHLGIEPEFTCGEHVPHANRADFPKYPALDRLIQKAKPIAEASGPVVHGLAKSVAKLTRPLRRQRGSGTMSDETRRALSDLYADSDAQLASWLGKPAPWRESMSPALEVTSPPANCAGTTPHVPLKRNAS